jgi:AAA family ATPase
LQEIKLIRRQGNCEALAAGITFTVLGKKKARKTYRIEKAESASPLFSIDDDTEIIMPGAGPSKPIAPQHGADAAANDADGSSVLGPSNGGTQSPNARPYHPLNTNGIGGLAVQCQLLNAHMRRMFSATSTEAVTNAAILLHGYSGTGKTLLLERLAASPFNKIIELNRANMHGGTIAKNQSIIRESFQEARNNQPSLVIMDDLEELVPADDTAYARTLIRELAQAHGSRVMVVGATRNTSNISDVVLEYPGFIDKIELAVPDQAGREQVLAVLRNEPLPGPQGISAIVASRTHGFTPRNLAELHFHALRNRDVRKELEQELELSAGEAAEVRMGSNTDGIDARSELSSTSKQHAPCLEDYEKALADQKVKPTALRALFTEKPKVRWDDIGGSEDLKDSFDEIIGWPLHHKEIYQASPNYVATKGVLLYGPPGCSKTLTAQAIAHTYDLNFIAIKGAALISMYVGESERAVREVFAKARLAAPCVIFFDEIDAIGADRDGGGTKGLNVLTTLLNEMDGFEPLKDVFILAATNKPESLDPALLRPGRFDEHVYLGPPNAHARKEILKIATKGETINADLDSVAIETEGYSGAEIVQICRAATKSARRRVYTKVDPAMNVTQEDFNIGKKRTRKGISPEMIEGFDRFAEINS